VADGAHVLSLTGVGATVLQHRTGDLNNTGSVNTRTIVTKTPSLTSIRVHYRRNMTEFNKFRDVICISQRSKALRLYKMV
jgi:hypothetical protein